MASVASFFVSRIDVLVDSLLAKRIAEGGADADTAKTVQGQVAIASAKSAYQNYKGIFGSERFQALAHQGASTQRLLWASTSTKNPEYSDVKYVEALIGWDTVDTVPMKTLNDYRDHGNPESSLDQEATKACWMLDRLPELGISLSQVTQQLEDEGVEKFSKAFDALMAALTKAVQK